MHKLMTLTFSAMLAIAGIAGAANAANFKDQTFGIDINIDDSLTKQPLLRDIQTFKSQDASGSLVIRRVYDLAIVDFMDEMRRGGFRDTRHQVTLRMNGEPVKADIEAGRGLLIPVSGQIVGQPVRGVIGAYSGHSGQGFLVIGTAKPEYWAKWEPRMKAMFESVRFIAIDRKAIAMEWEDRLKGKKLAYKSSNVTGNAPAGMYSGGMANRDYHLCSDGTMISKSASTGQVATPNVMLYGQGMNQGRGTWHVTINGGDPFLVIREGTERGLRLEYEHDHYLLDGMPYIITASDQCK